MAMAPRSLEERAPQGASLKALIVRFSAIGDCVMAVPVAVAIRELHPDAKIFWAVEPRCSAVIDTERLVTRLAHFERDKWEQRRWNPSTWFEQIKRYTSLRKYGFDIGIDLQGHSKTALCLRLANPMKRISIRATDVLAGRLNPMIEPPGSRIHDVERNMSTLEKLGDFCLTPKFDMPGLDAELAEIEDLLPKGRPLATITVSTGQQRKNYPLSQWLEVAAALVRQGWFVAWLGGPSDPQPDLDGTTNLVGKLSLRQTMAAVASSTVHLAADTGTGHIAAAYGVPVASVFGATTIECFRPYTDRAAILDARGGPANVKPVEIVEAVIKLREEYHA